MILTFAPAVVTAGTGQVGAPVGRAAKGKAGIEQQERAATGVNPVVKMFPGEIVYHQGFNDGTLIPEIGSVKKVQDPKSCEFGEGGVFGGCLVAGSLRFGQDSGGEWFLNTLAPWTLIVWVRYVEDPPQGEKTGFDFFFADVDAPPGDRGRFMMLKLHDCAIAGIYEYFEGKKRFAKSTTTAVAYERSWSNPWRKGEWRMFALSYGAGKLSISQNGTDLHTVALDKRVYGPKGVEIRAPSIKGTSRFYELDEVTVLNRELSENELIAIYKESIKE